MQIKITLKELKVFQTIAECKTVQAAAIKLNITQSAASQTVAKLESRLNTPLFDRNGRQLIINENGRLLLPLAMNTLNSALDIETLFSANQISLTIGASTTIGNYVMPTKLAQFRKQYPLSKVNMVVDNTEAIINAVVNFKIDIGLIEGICSHNEIILQDWQTDELVIFSAYRSNKITLTNEQLQSSPWLLREKGSGTRYIVEHFLNSQLGTCHLDMELGNSEAIKYAVAAGLGVSCLSRYVVDDLLLQNKVSLIHSSLPKLTRQFYIITHRNKQYTQGMNRFLDLII